MRCRPHAGVNASAQRAPMTVAAHSRPQPDQPRTRRRDRAYRSARSARGHALKANGRQAGSDRCASGTCRTGANRLHPGAHASSARVYRRAATAEGDISVVAATARARAGEHRASWRGATALWQRPAQPPVDIDAHHRPGAADARPAHPRAARAHGEGTEPWRWKKR